MSFQVTTHKSPEDVVPLEFAKRSPAGAKSGITFKNALGNKSAKVEHVFGNGVRNPSYDPKHLNPSAGLVQIISERAAFDADLISALKANNAKRVHLDKERFRYSFRGAEAAFRDQRNVAAEAIAAGKPVPPNRSQQEFYADFAVRAQGVEKVLVDVRREGFPLMKKAAEQFAAAAESLIPEAEADARKLCTKWGSDYQEPPFVRALKDVPDWIHMHFGSDFQLPEDALPFLRDQLKA